MERKQTFLTGLPGWLKNLAFVAGFMGLFWLSEWLVPVGGEGTWGLLGFFVLVAVFYGAAMLAHTRTVDPEDVIADHQKWFGDEGRSRRRIVKVLLVGGIILCFFLVGIVSIIVFPGDPDRQFSHFLFSAGVITAGLSIPFVVMLLSWLGGYFIKQVDAKGTFLLEFDGDPLAALAARADVSRIAEVTDGIGRAERLADGTGAVRLHPENLFYRLAGMGQVAQFQLAADHSRLEIRTQTDKGDTETIIYRVVSGQSGRGALTCDINANLTSSLAKLAARAAGPNHLIKGGALVEARRFERLIRGNVATEVASAEYGR